MSRRSLLRLPQSLFTRSVFVILLVVAAGIGTSTTASADQATPVSPRRFFSQQGMYVVGFNAEVAAANGYKIVTYPNGSQQSVPIEANDPTKTASPIVDHPITNLDSPVSIDVVQDTKYGNCGYSYIEGDQIAAHKIWLRSGFGINAPAIQWQWTIELHDQNGISYQGAYGPVPAVSQWSHEWDNLNQFGWSSHDVIPPSWAMRADGAICTSAGPGIFWYVWY